VLETAPKTVRLSTRPVLTARRAASPLVFHAGPFRHRNGHSRSRLGHFSPLTGRPGSHRMLRPSSCPRPSCPPQKRQTINRRQHHLQWPPHQFQRRRPANDCLFFRLARRTAPRATNPAPLPTSAVASTLAGGFRQAVHLCVVFVVEMNSAGNYFHTVLLTPCLRHLRYSAGMLLFFAADFGVFLVYNERRSLAPRAPARRSSWQT